MSSLNQPSTRFSHDELVGVKCRCQRARLGWASQSATGGALWAERLSNTTWISRSRGTCRSISLKNAQHVVGGVAASAVVEDLAGGDVQRGEQVGGAVALVVMGHRAGPAGLAAAGDGWVRSSAWTLGLLIEAEHHRPLRRVQVQPDDIDQLLFEARVVGHLERLHPPRLEVVVPPDPGHRVLADPVPGRHRPGRPVRRAVIRGRRAACHRTTASTVPWRQPGLAAPPRRDPAHPLDAVLGSNRRRHARTESSRRHDTGGRPRWSPRHRRPTTTPWPAPPCDAATTTTEPSAPTPPAAPRSWATGAHSPPACCHPNHPS